MDKSYSTAPERQRFRSGIDWWIWCMPIIYIAVVIMASLKTGFSAGMIILNIAPALTLLVILTGFWYEIDGSDLVIRQLFIPRRFPISKITQIRYNKGYTSTIGMSRQRISIDFTDHSILKSFMPLQISPADRDRFSQTLHRINPDITIIK